MSALAHLINPPTPIVRSGRLGGLGWIDEPKIRARSDGALSKGELTKQLLAQLATGPKSPEELASALKRDRRQIYKPLLHLMGEKVVARTGVLEQLPLFAGAAMTRIGVNDLAVVLDNQGRLNFTRSGS